MVHLFVYGTLRPAASDTLGRRARERLSAESAPVGRAHARGRLYDLGRYPGLWIGAGPVAPVAGEVVALGSPQTTFGWLDRYEGEEYVRRRVAVELASGGTLECWLYALRRVPEARLIAGGDWLEMTASARAAISPRASSRRRQPRRSRS